MIKQYTSSDLLAAVDTSAYIDLPLSDWRPILSVECQVYVFGENYIAKRFDQIHYKFCEKNEAKDVLIDNLYALLRYKYFTKTSEDIDDRIAKIIASFVANLKTTLYKISFDANSDTKIVHLLPDSCIAFRNGVFDFNKNKWLFKYDVISLKHLSNKIYSYDNKYIILWYMDFDFEPLAFSIHDVTLQEFVDLMKDYTKQNKNYCFELMYNISHDINDVFSLDRLDHLCQVLGYTCLQSFSQYFIMLMGGGQNGKNSLFDGCFINKVTPKPAANDLDSIENDRFITGALENRCHNIFLETSPKIYTQSKMIKALTGSMYQTIEQKGVNKYSGLINCKYVFSGNDQDKIKFSDVTPGFKRRINIYEFWYQWDASKKFLKRGDYYDTSFSDDLRELKDNSINSITYLYFAMFGIMKSTSKFTRSFRFTFNEWNMKYSDMDLDIHAKLKALTPKAITKYSKISASKMKELDTALYCIDKKTKLHQSKPMNDLGYKTLIEVLQLFDDEELSISFFLENDIYISVRLLQNLCVDKTPAATFSANIKKMFNTKLENIYANKPYVKCTFIKNKLKIL